MKYSLPVSDFENETQYCQDCWEECELCSCEGSYGDLEVESDMYESNAELESELPECRPDPLFSGIRTKSKREHK